MMDSYSFANLYNEATINGGGKQYFSDEQMQKMLDFQSGKSLIVWNLILVILIFGEVLPCMDLLTPIGIKKFIRIKHIFA